jgi:histidinol dehydrogenase
MNIIRYPERLEWNFLLKRSALQTESLRETVCDILEKVRTQGDRAVIGYEEQFDKVKLNSLEVTEKEFEEAEKELNLKQPSCWH